MSHPHRLPESAFERGFGLWLEKSRPLSFRFDGKRLKGLEGDSLASALMAGGIRLMGRSFKYHRPRSLLAAGPEEPNALVGVGAGGYHEPNLRATLLPLHDGMEAVSQNRWPSLERDIYQVLGWASRILPAGFYYKTFMWPRRMWPLYEHVIRHIAGLGRVATEPDPDDYEQIHVRCDVLVAGAGLSGLLAARSAADSGDRVIIADENPRPGGRLWDATTLLDGRPGHEWAGDLARDLAARENVQFLPRTTVMGHYHHNHALLQERVRDHEPGRTGVRRRLWKVRAGRIIAATGALERPLVFANNDRPGVMLAGSVRALLRRYGVAAGRRAVVVTNNDGAYRAALDMHAAGMEIACIVDVRESVGAMAEAARSAGMVVKAGHAVVDVEGSREVKAVRIAPLRESGRLAERGERVACDVVAMSGGWTPVTHLWCHAGGKLAWDSDRAMLLPDTHPQNMQAVGAAAGSRSLKELMRQAAQAGGSGDGSASLPSVDSPENDEGEIRALWFIPGVGAKNTGSRHFVDFQNDVTAADVELASREGYQSVEHLKRYTTMGMAPDQGKTSNVNALALLADTLGSEIGAVGTTTFRPPYTPLTFGVIAGANCGGLFSPIRRTAVTPWHQSHRADFEPYALWRRPFCYPRGGESRHDAANRETMIVRRSVGMIDVSTLGKIEVRGPDAGRFLDRVYTNMFSTLKEGRCRYGLMLNENGFMMDDGVTVKLGPDHYLVHTTSGGVDQVHAWLELWLQTEWPEMKVFTTPVTEQWAQISLAGPKSRAVLESLESDIDFSHESFAFMDAKIGTLCGLPCRVYRISFSGELSYEVAVPARHGLWLWERFLEAGAVYDIGVYGTEAMHILRCEKGYIVMGDETDGSVTPLDLGLEWALSKKKADYIGKRSLERAGMCDPDRKCLVGLLTEDLNEVLPVGAYAVDDASGTPPMDMIGHVTSSHWSPTLDRSIAMALIVRGRERLGEAVFIPLEDKVVRAVIADPVFYDPEGDRQNV